MSTLYVIIIDSFNHFQIKEIRWVSWTGRCDPFDFPCMSSNIFCNRDKNLILILTFVIDMILQVCSMMLLVSIKVISS